MFQANWVDPQCIRPAIYHKFGRAKNLALGTLQALQAQGWEPLAATLAGVEEVRAAWHASGWRPFSGMVWRGNTKSHSFSAIIRDLLLLSWVEAPQYCQHKLFPQNSVGPKCYRWSVAQRRPVPPEVPPVEAAPLSESTTSNAFHLGAWEHLGAQPNIARVVEAFTVVLPKAPAVPLFIRGFSAGSYTGATVSLIAPLSRPTSIARSSLV